MASLKIRGHAGHIIFDQEAWVSSDLRDANIFVARLNFEAQELFNYLNSHLPSITRDRLRALMKETGD